MEKQCHSESGDGSSKTEVQSQKRQSKEERDYLMQYYYEDEEDIYHDVISQTLQNSKKNLKERSSQLKNRSSRQDLNETQTQNVLYQGYLDQRTQNFFNEWKKLYGILTNKRLIFFSDQNRYIRQGCISLNLLPTKIKQQEQKLSLEFNGQHQPLTFRFTSLEVASSWAHYLEQVVNQNQQFNKVQFKEGKADIYNTKEMMTETYFKKFCQTGDIILCKTKYTICALQRFITNSDYDHVGMVFKFKNGQVKIYESNQNDGVCIYDWDTYVKRFNQYEEVCYRKLICDNKDQLLDQLLRFAKEAFGKKYDLTAYKILLKKKSAVEGEMPKNNGYFCSQLLVKAYKSIKLIESNEACSKFWPIDFTDKVMLPFKKGVYLDIQILIVLNNHLRTNL